MMPKIRRLLRYSAPFVLLAGVACAQSVPEPLLPMAPTAMPSPAVTPAPSTPTQETEDAASVPAQVSLFSPQQLREDLIVLRATLEEAHPGLYTYVDKATRDAQFDDLLDQLDHEMSDITFYRLITPLITDIRDAHTAVWPAADSVVYAGEHANFLPFTMSFIEDRAFVDAVHSPDAGVSPRTEVLSINGLPLADVVAQLLPYVPHDGFTATGQLFLLGRAFPIYYGFAFNQSPGYSLTVRDPATSETNTIVIRPLKPVELAAFFQELTNPSQNLSLEILKDETIAIMTIGSFGDSAIATFLADSFQRLKELEIGELIIDLRGNGGGGNHPGGLLYTYLADEPFRYYDHLEIVLDAPLTHLEHTDLSATRLNEILTRAVVTGNGGRQFPHWYGFDQLQQNRPDAYNGNVYILVDGGSGSSTAEFAAVAHHNRRGIFIGEETGGTYLSNNSGEMPTLTLPNTGIKVIVPLFKYVMAVSDPPFGRGILPDYPVTPTVEDFLSGIDSQLEIALKLIQESSSSRLISP